MESDELFNLILGSRIIKLLALLDTQVLKELSNWLLC
jgi:hypothetical protein